jgi:hypothetical protein
MFRFGLAKTKDDEDGAGTSDGKDAATNSLSDVPRKWIRFQQETEASVSDGSIVILPLQVLEDFCKQSINDEKTDYLRNLIIY